MRRGVAAEQVLAHRAARDEPRAHRGELRPDQREPVVERLQRALELAGGRQRLGEADEQLEPPREHLGGLGQQPQRGGEAVGGGGGRAGRGVAPGLDQHLHRLGVTGPRAALEVVARAASEPPRSVSAAAARPWAAIRQPSAAES